MASAPHVRLSLSNRPENVLVVRQALTGVGECLGLNAIESNDLNTAVSEACNNVVMHAYEGGEGPMEVDVYALPDGVCVVVRDRGRGLGGHGEDLEQDRVGLGIPVIQALTREARLSELPQGGTEVRMEFAAPDARALEPMIDRRAPSPAGGEPAAGREGEGEEQATVVSLSLAPDPVARAVLPRVLSTLAARAHFSTDRISDVQLVADVLASNAGESHDRSYLGVRVGLAPRTLSLRIGPLHAGRGESVMSAAADGLAPIVERLTDATRVVSGEAGETLELQLVDRR
jgi:serine/threonine-protein kinase RsbW